ASHRILPHPRLRFMDSQGHIRSRRQAEPIGPQPLVVDSVPRLMQDAKKGGGKKPLVVTSRNPAIVRPQGCAERMCRLVEASALEAKADLFGGELSEPLLGRRGKISRQDLPTRSPIAIGNGSYQRRQLLLQRRQ